ncbi:endonuclease/exonuclease/phosphatase family protein [Flavobacteriaceae bacterium]|nr:endonuclease/exonuclease/phosphatase family protein [Flavobacteriaceae bacterium]
MKKLDLIDKFFFLINSIFASFLILCYIIPYIDPEVFPHLAILSLSYPVLLLINLIFVIIWIVKLKPQFLLSLLLIGLGYQHLHDFFTTENKNSIEVNDTKILSYNVRRFNQFNWIKSTTVKQDICNFINKQQADIICLQEYLNHKNTNIQLKNGYKRERSAGGLVIYTNYPIVNSGSFNFKGTSNNVIFADLKINKDTVRIYNCHFQSYGLDTSKDISHNNNLIKHFTKTFKRQAEQVAMVKDHMSLSPYKSILVGDFNNTAFSWNYNELIEGKKDAFVEAGMGFGRSFNYIFPFRIDFILVEKSMEVHKFDTFPLKLSDHYPITATIKVGN